MYLPEEESYSKVTSFLLVLLSIVKSILTVLAEMFDATAELVPNLKPFGAPV